MGIWSCERGGRLLACSRLYVCLASSGLKTKVRFAWFEIFELAQVLLDQNLCLSCADCSELETGGKDPPTNGLCADNVSCALHRLWRPVSPFTPLGVVACLGFVCPADSGSGEGDIVLVSARIRSSEAHRLSD